MAVELRFAVFGDDQVVRTIDRVEEAAADMRPVWEVLADRFVHLERRQFATEGTYSGGWAPLSPRYAAWKARAYPGKTILRRTDELWRSLTEGPEVRIIEPAFMVLGSAVDYGAYHQKGGPNLPQRRPVELSENERREWVRIMQRYIVTGSVGAARASNLRARS